MSIRRRYSFSSYRTSESLQWHAAICKIMRTISSVSFYVGLVWLTNRDWEVAADGPLILRDLLNKEEDRRAVLQHESIVGRDV